MGFEKIGKCLVAVQQGLLVGCRCGASFALQAFLAAGRDQLQACNPAVGHAIDELDILCLDVLELRPEKLLRFILGKAQVAKVQFQGEVLAAQAGQRQRHLAA
ncbi:hypothetical protein D3C76_1167860 [compost metagenome]